MDLFASVPTKQLPGTPLAERLRPEQLDELVGQERVKQQIHGFLKAKHLPSLILWGPPGTGKTSLALLLAKLFNIDFVAVTATESGAKELREIGERARSKRQEFHSRTLLFVDEIHRFNKAQQDVLLPFVEKGDLVLVGATTENPSYELNRALLSRARTLVLERLSEDELRQLLEKASQLIGLGKLEQIFSQEALEFFVDWADGDARRALTALEELIALRSSKEALSLAGLTEILGKSTLGYDKNSQQHYDIISAFIKSIRGSDADAGLYYLARMVKGGEDPLFIARRLMILASEDVGNADPRALQVAVSGAQAVQMIGWPEAAINLAQVVCYLASAPKSNRSYLGLKKAQELVERSGTLPVPGYLRSGQVPKESKQQAAESYKYPHDHPKAWVKQGYLPDQIQLDEPLYEPASIGFEKQIQEFRRWLKEG